MDHQIVLVLDDDSQITEGLAMALEVDGRTVITCNDVEAAQVIVERYQVATIVSDVKLSGPFGFEGLEFLRYVRTQSPTTRVVVMTGSATTELRDEATRRGAFAFLQKPFDISSLESLMVAS